MAQAAEVSTDELLSQLASTEIDRLLAEAENGGSAPKEPAPAPAVEAVEPAPKPAESAPVAEGSERAALLQAAGFESSKIEASAAPAAPVEGNEERSAILQAAGFESAEAVAAASEAESDGSDGEDSDYVPIYLKPLVWINSPLEAYPSVARRMLGGAGIVTLLNALAVLTYVCFFRKH